MRHKREGCWRRLAAVARPRVVGLRRRRRRRHRRRHGSAAASRRVQRRAGQGVQPVRQEGRHAQVRHLRRLGLRRPRRHLLRLLLELRSASTAGRWSCSSRPRATRATSSSPTWPRAWASPATAARPGRTSCARASSSRTAPTSRPRTSSTRVLRSIDKETFPNGPTYFDDFLDLPEGYKGPYKTQGRGHRLGDRDPGRPHHRLPPEAAVRRLRLLGASCRRPCRCRRPRTPARSTRSTSSPPARTCSTTYEPGKSFTLVRNPNWDPATDPNRKALPDGYEVTLNVNADDIDNRLHLRRPRRRHRRHRCAAGRAGQVLQRPGR